MMNYIKILSCLFFCLAIVFNTNAQEINTYNELPFDKDVKIGKLENGLTYFIKHNAKPENRAELALVVDAGSVDEDDDQRGFAHFAEHMAFNGTKNFPKHKLIEYMESIGMSFGADVNAYTSFDETVYTLTVPMDNEEYINNALLVMHDWAGYILDENEEIENERGVIFEEKRSRLGSQTRIMNQVFPLLAEGSKYAERMIIGEDDIILKGECDALRRFRNDWYHPDLQALVVVGDFDVDKMENKIKQIFSAIPKNKNPRLKEHFEIPVMDSTRAIVVTDIEQQLPVIMHTYIAKSNSVKTEEDLKMSYTERIFYFAFNERLRELSMDINTPFLQAGGSSQGLMGGNKMATLYVVPKDKKINESYSVLLEEAERLARYGITKGEFNRAITAYLQSIENSYNSRSDIKSKSLLQEYVNFYLNGDISMSSEDYYQIAKKLVSTIAIDDINSLIRKTLGNKNQIIVLQAPEKEKDSLPSTSQLMELYNNVQKKEIENVVEEELDLNLIEKLPNSGKVVQEQFDENYNITRWELQNGVKVILKPCDFEKNEISMSAFSQGGLSLYDIKDLPSAENAVGLVSMSGVGGFNPIQLRKILTGKSVSVRPSIRGLYEGISGSCISNDFETMMQLSWLYFTKPNKDKAAYDRLLTYKRESLKNIDADLKGIFNDSINYIFSDYHPRVTSYSKEEYIDQINFEKAYSVYNERFADAKDFTFVFVGDFEVEDIKPYIELYLGSLASSNAQEKYVDHKIRTPKGIVEKSFELGKENKTNFYLSFNSELKYTVKNRILITAVAQLLSESLLKNIREEKGGAYSLGASPYITNKPSTKSGITISFPCSPDRVNELKEAIFSETEKIVNNEFNDESLHNVKEILLRRREVNEKSNSFWKNIIVKSEKDNVKLENLLLYNDIVNDISRKDIVKCAKEVLDNKQYIFVYTLPVK